MLFFLPYNSIFKNSLDAPFSINLNVVFIKCTKEDTETSVTGKDRVLAACPLTLSHLVQGRGKAAYFADGPEFIAGFAMFT